MVILGLILLIAGYALGSSLLVLIGWILLIVGLVLLLLSFAGHEVGGRRWY